MTSINKLTKAGLAAAMVALISASLPAQPAEAAMGLTLLGSSNSGYSFSDVASPVANPGAAVWVPSAEGISIAGSNIYAANPVKVSASQWNVYYGGWVNSEGLDDVLLRTTPDSAFRASYFSAETKVVPRGFYIHANDPSVVLRNSVYTMALTVFRDYDSCAMLQSSNGVSFPALTDRSRQVTFSGATVTSCARPSLNWNATANRWEMYFDGVVNGGALQQHVAYSTQTVPTSFVYQQAVGPWVDADVHRLANGSYVSAFRWTGGPAPAWDIRYATSADGLTWTTQQPLLAPDPTTSLDDFGVTNPGLAIDGSTILAMLYGLNDSPSWDSHSIGVAYPQLAVTLKTGATEHVHRHANGPDGQTVTTYGNVPDAVVVKDAAGTTLLSQAGTLVANRVWSVQNRTLATIASSGVSSSSPNGSFPASNATDGNAATFSSTTGVGQNSSQWLTLDLGSQKDVRGVQLTRRADGPWGFPVDFAVQVSSNGTQWFTVPLQSYTAYVTPGTGATTLAFSGIAPGRYVRLASTKQSTDQYGNYYLQIAEFRALG